MSISDEISRFLTPVNGNPVLNRVLIKNLKASFRAYGLKGLHDIKIIDEKVVIRLRNNVSFDTVSGFDAITSWFECSRRDPVIGKRVFKKPNDFQKRFGCAPTIEVVTLTDAQEEELRAIDFNRHCERMEKKARKQSEMLEKCLQNLGPNLLIKEN